jgi:hypothetical protein
LAVFGWVLVAVAGSQLHDSLDTNFQGFQLLPPDAIRHTPTQTLHQNSQTTVVRERKSVKAHTFPQSRDRSALTTALNPWAFDGTTINFSPFSWAVRPTGQDDRNQVRKLHEFLAPVIKMGVLFGRCPTGKKVLFTWAFGMVPSGFLHRRTDM